jgi:predicted metal-dependent RNase
LDSFSAHADKAGLEEYLSFSSPHDIKKLFLVHGEKGAAEEFLELARDKGYKNSCVPELDEEYYFYLQKNEYSGKYEVMGRDIKKPKKDEKK